MWHWVGQTVCQTEEPRLWRLWAADQMHADGAALAVHHGLGFGRAPRGGGWQGTTACRQNLLKQEAVALV